MNIENLLKQAVLKQASDLHLFPMLPPFLRIDGELQPMSDEEVLTPEMSKSIALNIMSLEQQEILQQELSLDMSFSLSDLSTFRVSVFHEKNGLAFVFRVVANKIPSFEELSLPSILKTLLLIPSGLILVTGATGSGKSTTLAAMIDYINNIKASHIITIEDPIEYRYESKKSIINQLQVGRDTPSFSKALRASLRQDPDVILIGELRDLETINMALTAAETGHIVLSTLHASSAPLAISRIIDVFPSTEKNRIRNLLAESLQAIICQTLVKRVDKGRTAAFEIMLANPAIRHYLRQDMIAHMETVIQTSGDVGMCTLEQSLEQLVVKQIVNPTIARSLILNREIYKTQSR